MATREKLMRRLSVLSTDDLLKLLNDETIFEVAQKLLDTPDPGNEQLHTTAPFDASITAVTPEPVITRVHERAKRPLNAFMAFRSYYLKIFPDVPQKAASGFLTTLWSKDPFRNKWALIAKVYSFVRDELGKQKVSLSFFLRICCPTMKIIKPSEYLVMLGWSIQKDEAGIDKLIQNAENAAQARIGSQPENFPDTETDLLASLLHFGYLPEDGHLLLGRLNTNNNGLMTTTSGSPGIKSSTAVNSKDEFINYVRASPLQAAKDLYGSDYDDNAFGQVGVAFHEVKNVGSFIPTRFEWPDTRPPYSYSTSSAQLYSQPCGLLELDNVSNTAKTFDIDNAWDVDVLLAHDEPEGTRSAGGPPTAYNRHQDFQFMF